KLAFSITAILETDIMLIDEVLSVGDIHFKEKSYNKMKELISNDDRTVVIVSHNSNTIKELCDKVIWLHDGLIKDQGDPKVIMDKYEEFMRNEG
ncbi:MAG: ABC transporter ATP-binding protein, partial [Bacilli bacterium]|nr:ABC transporter ATP-binding protein [Bacilli bacterium]